MSRKSSDIKSRSAASGPEGRTDKRRNDARSADLIARHMPSPAAIRETIESVVIAFVLAFLVPHLRGRGVCDSHRLDGADVDGTAQGLICPKCGCPVSGQRQRGSGLRGRRNGETIPDRGRHVPDVPLHGHWGDNAARTTLVQRRPHPGGQVRLTIWPSRSGGT